MRLAALPLLLAPLLLSPLAQAAALSVCTEASPEGFDVVQYNSLTTTNVSADVLMNRLVDFDTASGRAFSGIGIKGGAAPRELGKSLHTDCIIMQNKDIIDKNYRCFKKNMIHVIIKY